MEILTVVCPGGFYHGLPMYHASAIIPPPREFLQDFLHDIFILQDSVNNVKIQQVSHLHRF